MYFILNLKREEKRSFMVKSFFNLFFAITLFSSLVSCAVSPDEMEVLDSSIRSYERAIRWGEFTRAKSFHKSSPVLSDLERRRLNFYRVTGYTVLQQDIPNKYNAHLMVEIKYVKKDMQVIKTITSKQHWKRDKDSKIWYLNSAFPEFR